MADLFDRYNVQAEAGATTGPPKGDLFDRYAPQGGGVQDFEPSQQPGPPGVVGMVNRGVNWLGTRATKALTGAAGMPRAFSDLNRAGQGALGLPFLPMDPVSIAGQFLPSTEEMNRFVFERMGVPEVNLPGRGGKIVDAGAEAGISALAGPGNFLRTVVPAVVGGAAQEIAGQATEGSRFEPVARLVAGVIAGGGAGVVQNALGNAGQAAKNLRPNVDKTAAKIIGRAMERDKVTGNALASAQADLGPGAMLVEAGGPNVRGTMRGSIAAPGQARTAAEEAFDTRIGGSNDRTTAALDKGISPNGSLAGTVDELADIRARAARPAYQAAGIPARPELRRLSINEEPQWNTPLIADPAVNDLIKKSPDIRAAMSAARRLPDYQGLPDNSMSLLDKAYKHLEGMEQEAKRAGNNTRAYDLTNLRRDFQKALTDANPQYQEALNAFAGPSKLIDAANRGKEWFTKNVDPTMVRREFETMSPEQQDAVRVGVRDWARTVIGRSDRGGAAERVWAGGDNRQRLEAILGPDGYRDLAKAMETEKNAFKTARDINVGSRTAPMLAENQDNALQAGGPWLDLLRGRTVSAAGQFVGNALNRIGQGQTEAVNARIAEMLTSADPKQAALIASLLEQARLQEVAKSTGRRNALISGGTYPAINALSGERR